MSGGRYIELFSLFSDLFKTLDLQLQWPTGNVYGKAVQAWAAPGSGNVRDSEVQHLFHSQAALQLRTRKVYADRGECAEAQAELVAMAAAANNSELALELQAAMQWTAEQMKHLRRTCVVEDNFVPVADLLVSIKEAYFDKVHHCFAILLSSAPHSSWYGFVE
jgi:hypothetical protein